MEFIAAAIQFAPVLGDIESNLKYVESRLAELAHADLVVLPELASTGYNFTDARMANSLAEFPAESAYIEMLSAMARKSNQYIISGFNEKANDGIYNSAVLVSPEGLTGVYRKLHLFMREKQYFKPGNSGLQVYDTGFCRLGMQICFDYLFPEPWRILAQQGADMIVHPSNLLTQNAIKALPGIALMNRVFILTANRTGTEGELTFNGNSRILDPGGDVVTALSADQSEVMTAVIDPSLSRDKMITELNHVFEDRRPEQYQ